VARSRFEPRRERPRSSVLDPFKPRIMQLLYTHPYSAQEIFQRLRQEGYRGGMTILRVYVRGIRPTERPVCPKLHFAPSECAQVSWAQFGHLAIGRASRPLMAFVMVLSYSRQIFLRFFLNARMENFLRGHVEAFGACPGSRGSSSTTISKALLWSATATPSVSIPPCSSWPDIIVTNHVP
jgi:transposase